MPNVILQRPWILRLLKKTLDGLLPSKTLLRWQPIKSLNIGIVTETVSYLKELELMERDREVIIIMDEMDRRLGLQYDVNRDCIIGFECGFEKFGKKIPDRYGTWCHRQTWLCNNC